MTAQNPHEHRVATPYLDGEAANARSAKAGHPPRYHLNGRLLIGTVIVVAVLAGLAHVSRGYFLARNAAMYLNYARTAEADGDDKKAVQYYLQYLQLAKLRNRNSPEADAQRGEILLKVGELQESNDDSPQALRRIALLYEEAARLSPESNTARRKLIPLLMRQRRYTDALQHIRALDQPGIPTAEAAELAFREGRCQESLNQLKEAQLRYGESLARDPRQMGSYLALSRIWATAGNAVSLSVRAADSGGNWRELDLLTKQNPKGVPGSPIPGAIALLLDRMVSANSTSEAELLRAQVLTSLSLNSDVGPLDSTLAQKRANEILKSCDANKDGRLSGDEVWRPEVPVLADVDHDREITLQELAARLELGDRAARLASAERALTRLAKTTTDASPRLASEVRLSLIGVLEEQANAADELSQEKVEQWLNRARELAREGMRLSDSPARFHLILSGLELRQIAAEESDEIRTQKLADAVNLLRQGLNSLPPSGAKKADFDEWTNPVSPADPQTVHVQLLFSLGRLLIYRAAAGTREEAVKILGQVRDLAAELRKIPADVHMPQYLEFRVAQLEELQFSKDSSAPPPAGKLLAMAMELARGVSPATPLAREIASAVGGTYLQFGDPGTALDIYRRQLKVDPLWSAGRAAAAEVLSRLGRTSEAIDEYQLVPGFPGVAERLARLLMLQQAQRAPELRTWDALDRYVAAIVEHSSKNQSKNRQQALVLQSDIAALRAATEFELAQLREDGALKNSAVRRLQNEEATLRDNLSKQSDAVELWTALAYTILRRQELSITERHKLVAAVLPEARKNAGPHADLTLIEVQMAVQKPRAEGLAVVEQIAGDLDSVPAGGRQRLVLALADAFAQFEQPHAARILLQTEAGNRPGDLELQKRLLQGLLLDRDSPVDERDSQWETALARIETIEGTADGTASLARVQRSLIELPTDKTERESRLKAARDTLTKIGRSRPYLYAVPHSLGLVEEELGRQNAAFAAYQKAISLGDTSAEVVTRLGALYDRRGQADEGKLLTDRFAREHASAKSVDLSRLRAYLADQAGQTEQALQLFTQVAGETGIPTDRLALATEYFASGERSPEALGALRKAADESNAWEMLVRYHARGQEWEQAEEAIKGAEEKFSANRTSKTAVTIAYLWDFLAGENGPNTRQYLAEAARQYEIAIKDFPRDYYVRENALRYFMKSGAIERAQAAIDYLLDPVRDIPREIRARIQQQKILLEARSGHYSDIVRAIDELKRNRTSGWDAFVDNLRLQLLLLQRLAEVDTLKEQKPLLLELESKDQLTLNEQLQLAAVLDALDGWADAQARYQKATQAYPDLAFPRFAFCNALLKRAESKALNVPDQLAQRDRLLEALDDQLADLKRIEPQSWRAAVVQARTLSARNQPAEATAVVQTALKVRLSESGDQRFRPLLEQENAQELVQSLANTAAARFRRDISDVLNSALRQIKRGQLAPAAKFLANSAAAPLFDDLLIETSRQAAQVVESWDKQAAEALYRSCVARNKSQQAPIDLARFLVKADRVDEALVVCNEHWDRMSPVGTAFILSLIAQKNDPEQKAKLEAVRNRVQGTAEQLAPAARSNLFMYLGNFDNDVGAYDQAIVNYQHATEGDRSRFVPLNNFAFLSARRRQNLEEAASAIEAALQIAGPRRELVDTKAAVLIAQNKPAEARELLRSQTAIASDPTILFRLAECYYGLKQTDLARTTLETALQKGLDLAKLHPLDLPVLEQIRQSQN